VSSHPELDQIEQQGFAIQRGVFSSKIIDESLHELLLLAPPLTRAGIRHALHFTPITKIASCPQLMALACGMLGPQAFPFRATIFDKSPDANWLVVWHQDTVLPLRRRMDLPGWGPWSIKQGIPYAHAPAEVSSQVLALRVHLDDSTADNGPLRVLPGTHTSGVLSDDRIHELAEHVTAVECIAPKGGVVAMRPLLIHASSKSHTEAPRRVLHIEYAASDSIANPLQLEIA
jgi:ectoine hydroxylase-related dioxygenase (phytanoyl-CoA dioxygenase family)